MNMHIFSILTYILKLPFKSILPILFPIATYEILSTYQTFSMIAIIIFNIFPKLTDEKCYPVNFLLLVRLNYFTCLIEIFNSSFVNDLLNYSAPFLFLQRVVHLLSNICLSLTWFYISLHVSVCPEQWYLIQVMMATLVCSLNLLHLQHNSRTLETHLWAYISSQMHFTNLWVT